MHKKLAGIDLFASQGHICCSLTPASSEQVTNVSIHGRPGNYIMSALHSSTETPQNEPCVLEQQKQ